MKSSNMKRLFAGLSSAAIVAASAMPMSYTAAQAAGTSETFVYGDANYDNETSVADATLIMQCLSNPSDYKLSAEGADRADVNNRGDGITAADALAIQKYMAGIIPELPESWQSGDTTTAPVVTTTTTEPITTTTTPIVDPVVSTIYIHLSDTGIKVEGDEAGYTSVSGSKVTISHSGTYYVDGTLSDGQIIVSIPDETTDADTVKIFLNGVNITGASDSAIYVDNAENTSINLVDGTDNYISDGDTAYSSGNAVIHAKDDMTIKGGDLGTGTLTVTANTQDGIVCNNDLKINNAIVDVTTLNETSGSKTNGINGKTSLTIKGTSVVTVDATSDGIKSGKGSVAIESGTVTVKAGADAIQSETTVDISGGTVTAGGDRGITPGTALNITGGTVVATATDNQVDSSLMSGTTQNTWLFNCIAESTDTTWKKANSFQIGSLATSFEKKYQYVLVSDSSLTGTKTITNTSTGATVTHSNDTMDSFTASGTITTFNNVNPAGTSGTTVDPTSGEYTITLSGTSIQTNAPSSVATISNNVLTIIQEGVFTVTGEGTGSQIVVDVDKTTYPDAVVELDLAGMSLTNTSTSPIYVASIGDEVVIVAKNGTENSITDGSSYTNADGDQGAIYSKDDLKFKGKGKLTVNGNAQDGIVGKDDIKIYNGTLVVNAVDDGIRGKDSVKIGNSDDLGTEGAYDNLSVTVKTNNGSTGGDGIKSTNDSDSGKGYVEINGGTININSYADGIQAEQEFTMNGGDLTIYTYQGSSYTGSGSSSSGSSNPWGGGGGGMNQEGNSNKTDISAKGIKAVGLYDSAGTTYQSMGHININGGTIVVDSSDDSIHCGGNAYLNAGKLTLSSADDAVHSDNSLYVGGTTAGTDYTSLEVYVPKCYEGFEGVYIYQNNGNIYIISSDDGYNAAGGADSSGSGNTGGGFNQGGGPGGGGGGMSESYGEMHLNGGIVSVNTSFNDADGFDSNGPLYITGGYYFGNGGDSFDCGDGYSISRTGGYAFGGLGMNGGSSYDMSSQMVFATSSGTVLASSMSGSAMSYAYGDSSVLAYSGATISGGTNISTLGQPAVYISGTVTGGTSKTLSSGSSGNNPWG